jgi:hypothetical protein
MAAPEAAIQPPRVERGEETRSVSFWMAGSSPAMTIKRTIA